MKRQVIQERVHAGGFIGLHTVVSVATAEKTKGGWVRSHGLAHRSGFALRCAELHIFAAKISETVETTVKIRASRELLFLTLLPRGTAHG